jgi:rare lipoprotein A
MLIRSVNARLAVLACATAGVLALPAAGQASSSGGGGLGSGAGGTGTALAQPGNVTVTASGEGMTIATRESALLSNGLSFSGSVPSSDAGDSVEIERSGPRTNWAWEPTAETTVASNGAFTATWETNHIGRFSIRAVLTPAGAAAASASGSWPTVTVTVYRPSIATLYGPGFWGHKTACGITLRRNTIGVANRTLPCGTPVAVYYGGRTLIVPVIDRGPYAHGADWDLTMATGRALGIEDTETIGAVSLPRNG